MLCCDKFDIMRNSCQKRLFIHINNIGIDSISPNKTLTLPLPTFLSVGISGGHINWNVYMFCLADDTNVYFYTINATGVDLGIWDVTYYLKRQLANQT